MADLQGLGDLELRVAQVTDGMFDEKRQRNREAFVETLSRFSAAPSAPVTPRSLALSTFAAGSISLPFLGSPPIFSEFR